VVCAGAGIAEGISLILSAFSVRSAADIHVVPNYKVVQIWLGQTVTCLRTISPGHIWTTLYFTTTFISIPSMTTNAAKSASVSRYASNTLDLVDRSLGVSHQLLMLFYMASRFPGFSLNFSVIAKPIAVRRWDWRTPHRGYSRQVKWNFNSNKRF
jgi:hypothetical protein